MSVPYTLNGLHTDILNIQLYIRAKEVQFGENIWGWDRGVVISATLIYSRRGGIWADKVIVYLIQSCLSVSQLGSMLSWDVCIWAGRVSVKSSREECETVTERRMTEDRKTERRITEPHRVESLNRRGTRAITPLIFVRSFLIKKKNYIGTYWSTCKLIYAKKY